LTSATGFRSFRSTWTVAGIYALGADGIVYVGFGTGSTRFIPVDDSLFWPY